MSVRKVRTESAWICTSTCKPIAAAKAPTMTPKTEREEEREAKRRACPLAKTSRGWVKKRESVKKRADIRDKLFLLLL